MLRCEICGKSADKHHIVHRCQGGIDYPLNIKHLCPEHHRGSKGPHKCSDVDLKYKLELQNKLEKLLPKEYYTIEKLSHLLEIKPRALKKLMINHKLHKEGYKKADVIYELMGKMIYDEVMLEHYYDFIPVFNLA
ncbi:HNH endonuclease [Clostridium thermarum]|uniref:HNH endonuclease n=1 Tax=Clostridium thermarum TaxID=1716543 RepID=UPI0013D253D9|nr:HNH endonuclease [Clostridium thermarum]